MLRIRTVKTALGAKTVQVMYYLNRKRVIYELDEIGVNYFVEIDNGNKIISPIFITEE